MRTMSRGTEFIIPPHVKAARIRYVKFLEDEKKVESENDRKREKIATAIENVKRKKQKVVHSIEIMQKEADEMTERAEKKQDFTLSKSNAYRKSTWLKEILRFSSPMSECILDYVVLWLRYRRQELHYPSPHWRPTQCAWSVRSEWSPPPHFNVRWWLEAAAETHRETERQRQVIDSTKQIKTEREREKKQ
ncbi:UNVERIFIED_CONTAM: hypothetical protein FKN15_037946 [Acipenser sinensis]